MSKFGFVRIRDNVKLYGILIDINEADNIQDVTLKLADKTFTIKADKLIPDWAYKSFLNFQGQKDWKKFSEIRNTHKIGYFEYNLSSILAEDYSQIEVAASDTSIISGSPLVIHKPNVSVLKQTDYFTAIPNEDLQLFGWEKFSLEIKKHIADNKKIICIPPFISWNIPLFQRPQHMALALAEQNAIFIYFSNQVDDVFSDVVSNGKGLYIVEHNYYDKFLSTFDNTYVIFYSTSPNREMQQVKATNNRLIYEYVDHIDPKISSTYAKELTRRFNTLNNDNTFGVIATAKVLYEEMQERFPKYKVLLNPNGVNCSHFLLDRENSIVKDDFNKIISQKKPIIGYYGAIAPWLDYDLIERVADLLPEYNFVYIGPLYAVDESALPKRDNIHWYGAIDYTDLANYAVWFDCSIIPFEKGSIAKTTSPLKLFEYFSLAKPVVVTSYMIECTQFDIVRSGSNALEFAEQVKLGLLNWNQELAEASIALAQEHDWLKRAESYVQFLDNLEKKEALLNLEQNLTSSNLSYRIENKFVTHGHVDIKVFEDNLAVVPHALRIKKDGFLKLKINICTADLEKKGIEFSFNFTDYLNTKQLEYQINGGGKTLSFLNYGVKSEYMTATTELDDDGSFELVIKALSDIELTSANLSIRLKNFRIINQDVDLFCNQTPHKRVLRGQDYFSDERNFSIFSLKNKKSKNLLQQVSFNLLKPRGIDIKPIHIVGRPYEYSLTAKPSKGDITSFNVDLSKIEILSSFKSVELKLSLPYFNPNSSDRIFYFIQADDEIIYIEDISLFSGLNSIKIPLPKNTLNIGLLSKVSGDDIWIWDTASKIQLFDIVLSPALINEVEATSKDGIILKENNFKNVFFSNVDENKVEHNTKEVLSVNVSEMVNDHVPESKPISTAKRTIKGVKRNSRI
ncbi:MULTISPECIES: hypothetical protein [Acinetobacter]|uniref:hypothetical protein n=1 Tax=Acinetobacter TaxID=469 RepID=UPI001F4AA615|nr:MULTISPECIES: hypothetical protein [Acinetobacter]MCH7379970.1 hypothetical protein [Acinetobacter higginsii]